MFFQLRNTLKYVSIRPCHRLTCECYQKFKPLSDATKTSISVEEYDNYWQCYKKIQGENRDIFLL